jgi:hypothetical protein
MPLALRARWRRLPLVVRIATGALIVPCVLLVVSGIRPSVAGVLAAELMYFSVLLAGWARVRLRRRFGPFTGVAALAVLAAISFAPLGLLEPGCSDGVASPYCHQEIAGWSAAGLVAAFALALLAVLSRSLRTVPAAVRLLLSALRRARAAPAPPELMGQRRGSARTGKRRPRTPKTHGRRKRHRRRR